MQETTSAKPIPPQTPNTPPPADNNIVDQEINFYALLPKRTTSFLNQKLVLLSYAGFVLLFVFMLLLFEWQIGRLKVVATTLDQEVVTSQAELQKLTQHFPVSNLADLRKSMKETQAEYEAKLTAMDSLSLNEVFSKYLTGLASATVEGVWLKEIDLNRTGNKIILRGSSLQHALLDQYLTQLAAQPAFAGMVFELQEFIETTTPASFLIATKSGG